MVERFNGRIQREVLGITVASHRDLETLLHGFNQAYNARRQRVLKGRSPDMVVRERLGATPDRANRSHDPPFDPCGLPKALQVIACAKDVSHPDTNSTVEFARRLRVDGVASDSAWRRLDGCAATATSRRDDQARCRPHVAGR